MELHTVQSFTTTNTIVTTIQNRYARHATFQIAVLPSKAKGDFDSFLAPIIDEINLLSDKTLVIKANGEAAVKCKVYILFINGDGIEANRMLNFQGHMS
jgi:hypothetical protein